MKNFIRILCLAGVFCLSSCYIQENDDDCPGSDIPRLDTHMEIVLYPDHSGHCNYYHFGARLYVYGVSAMNPHDIVMATYRITFRNGDVMDVHSHEFEVIPVSNVSYNLVFFLEGPSIRDYTLGPRGDICSITAQAYIMSHDYHTALVTQSF